MRLFLAALLGYAFGSVPFAYLVTRRRRGGLDIRSIGSGNVGATNVRRAAGTLAAVITACLDVAKGAAAVQVAAMAGLGHTGCAVAGAAAVVGHVYPVWLRLRGGKGVSTALGAALVWHPWVAVAALGVFVVAAGVTRMVSVGSVLAAAVMGPLAQAWHSPPPMVMAAYAVGALVVFRHRSNVKRILAGTERRV